MFPVEKICLKFQSINAFIREAVKGVMLFMRIKLLSSITSELKYIPSFKSDILKEFMIFPPYQVFYNNFIVFIIYQISIISSRKALIR